jgi:CheY-like chemotaxis protein
MPPPTPTSGQVPAPEELTGEALAIHLGHPPVILVADDNEATRMALSDFLRALPASVVTAGNGEEALAQATPVDLIVMDIQMPGLDGLEAIRRLKAAPETKPIPVVALTALAMPGDRERCLAAGADAYLSKPAKLDEFVRTITHLLAGAPSNR